MTIKEIDDMIRLYEEDRSQCYLQAQECTNRISGLYNQRRELVGDKSNQLEETIADDLRNGL